MQSILTVTFMLQMTIRLVTAIELSSLLYDYSLLTSQLDDRYPYLKLKNGSYIPPRDYFNFSSVFRQTKEYYEQVNIEDHYYHELRAMEFGSSIATMDQWHYSDDGQLRKSGLPEANGDRCHKELHYLSRQIKLSNRNSSRLFTKGKWNIEFLRFIDSWGRPPSETYLGNSYWTGSYRGCRLARLALIETTNNTRQAYGNSKMLQFRYCWAKLRARDWPEDDEIIPPTSIRVGVCLPKSCDTRFANNHSQTVLQIMQFNFSPMYKQRFNKLIDIYCLPNERSMASSGQIFAFVTGTWISIVILASLLRYAKLRLPNIFNCLTLQENFNRYLDDNEPSEKSASRVDLRSLGVLRFFGSCIVCLAHIQAAFIWVNYASTPILAERFSTWNNLFPSWGKSMHLFFVVGGLLASFTLIAKYPGNGTRALLDFKVLSALQILRYLRLAPIAILVMAFMKTIFPHLGEGPFWDYGTDKFSVQGRCQRSSWWRVLLVPVAFGYKGDYYTNECLLPSWYLVADMKMFLVVPLIVHWVSSRKSIASGAKIALGFCIFSALCEYKDYSMQNSIYLRHLFEYSNTFATNMLGVRFGESGYHSAATRISSVVVGIFAGICLKRYQLFQIKMWPFWMRGWSLRFMILYELYDVYSPVISTKTYATTGAIPSDAVIKLAIALKPRIDAIIFAILALRLTSDLAPRLMRLSLAIYKLSKLTYCVFLIHSIIISYMMSANERSRFDTYYLQLVVAYVFVVVASFLLSFPLYLFFESPLALLLNLLMGHGGARAKRKSL